MSRIPTGTRFALAVVAAMTASTSWAQCPPPSWTVLPDVPPGTKLNDVAYGDGTFVAVGDNAELLTSVDGLTWTDIDPTPLGFSFLGIAHGDGTFVACGGNGRIDVLNGPNAGAVSFGSGVLWTDVAYGNGTWVVVGGFFDLATGWFEVIARSTNGGANWTIELNNPVNDALDPLVGIDFGGGRFLAVSGDGDVRSSTNGANWTLGSAGTSELNCIVYGDGVWIAGADGGTIRRSTNGGASWTSANSGSAAYFGGAFGDGGFVLVGQNGAIITSPTGSGWSTIASGTTEQIENAAFGSAAWVGVGSSAPGGQLIVLGACGAPDLAAYSPPGWTGPIVVSAGTGTNNSTAITDADTVFIDAAWNNAGNISAAPFSVEFSISGGPPLPVGAGPLEPFSTSGAFQFVTDLAAGPLPVGAYTVEVLLDADSEIDESDEVNNLFTMEFEVVSFCPADLDGNGQLNVDDIDAFVTAFLAGDAAADCDGSGSLNVDDIDCFVAAFLAGCP